MRSEANKRNCEERAVDPYRVGRFQALRGVPFRHSYRALTLAALAAACGSKTTTADQAVDSSRAGASSGGIEGTDSGGRAGSIAGRADAGNGPIGTCNPGDTRPCTGPAACRGGQSCRADAQWSACDCGDATTGGRGGTDGVAGDGGAGGTVDEQPSGGGGSSGDTAVGGGAGTGIGVLDEPCLTDSIDVDCSGHCAPRASICDKACPSTIAMPPLRDGLIIARLPSHPKADCTCNSSKAPFIDAEPAVYALAFEESEVSTTQFVLSVPEPWKITYAYETGCASKVSQVQCIVGLTRFTVWTSDPNAPAVNLVVRAGSKCP